MLKKNVLAVILSGLLFSSGSVLANSQSFADIKIKADAGDSDAQSELGNSYLTGDGVKKDPKKAFEWFLKAAQQSNAEAQYYVGKSYQQALGVKKDLPKAFEWLSKAAKNQNLKANYELGLMYEAGQGVKQDFQQAIQHYQRVQDKFDNDAGPRIGKLYFTLAEQETDPKKALQLYELALKNYNGNAAKVLAKKYAIGDGVVQDKSKALKLYERFFRSPDSEVQSTQPEFISQAMYWVDRLEANPNDAEAQYYAAKESYNNLFKLYEPYIPYDLAKVAALYKQSAEQGYTAAQYEYAEIIRSQDPKYAFALIMQAAEKGHVSAQMVIAGSYASGNEYLEKDIEKSKFWYQKTKGKHQDTGDAIQAEYAQQRYQALGGDRKVDNNDLDANYSLVSDQHYFIFKGYPASKANKPEDIQKAIALYLPLAQRGHSLAQYQLADLYAISGDETSAVKWYQTVITDFGKIPYKAVTEQTPQQILAKAKYQLAQLYANGTTTIQQPAKALSLYNESASVGWSQAQYQLAQIYQQGLLGQVASPPKALYWYIEHASNKNTDINVKKSAAYVVKGFKEGQQIYDFKANKLRTIQKNPATVLRYLYQIGSLESYLDIAQAHEKGEGTAVDYETALNYYRYAMDKDNKDPRAYFYLARLFSKDLGIKEDGYTQHARYTGKDEKVAFYYYQKAAELGHVLSQYFLGRKYDLGEGVAQSYTKAVEWYSKAAAQGQRRAQYHLGLKYENGQGIKQNIEKAIALYQQAVTQNLDAAQYTLAIKYDRGLDVEQDIAKALDLYLKAANQGHKESQYNLGVKYDSGQGVTQDFTQAFKWYLKAAEQGYADAQYNLALMYDKGQGVVQNEKQALHWYSKAAQAGQAAAQNHFGVLHDAKGGSLNDMIAVSWYKLAATQGYADAEYNLATMYEEGQGVEQSYSTAFEWYQKAAAKGHNFAQYNLAWMYEQGQGIKQNYKKAAELYAILSKQGNKEAQRGLERVKEHVKFSFLS